MARTWGELLGDDGRRTRRRSERAGFFGAAARLAVEVAPGADAAARRRAFDPADEEAWERLEEALIGADVGVPATAEIVRRLEARGGLTTLEEPLAEELAALLGEPGTLDVAARPSVILVVGVNGTGKTTTIGKLAAKLAEHGRSVLLARRGHVPGGGRGAARDLGGAGRARTSSARRAAATRPRSPTTRSRRRRARGRDVVIVDTAGRLHTQTNLMEELAKVRRVIAGRLEGAPHETLLVVDATTGQNGLQQARLFGEAVGVTGRRADEAGRLGEGRDRGRDRPRARPAGEARRRRGGARRPPAVRPARLRRALIG